MAKKNTFEKIGTLGITLGGGSVAMAGLKKAGADPTITSSTTKGFATLSTSIPTVAKLEIARMIVVSTKRLKKETKKLNL